jgi:hypothetical protein
LNIVFQWALCKFHERAFWWSNAATDSDGKWPPTSNSLVTGKSAGNYSLRAGGGEELMKQAMARMISRLHRVGAWLSVPALVLASWTPGEHMMRTGVNGRLEHIAAYFVSALLWVTAYPRWSPWVVGSALASCAGVLEVGRFIFPGGTVRSQTLPRVAWVWPWSSCRQNGFVDPRCSRTIEGATVGTDKPSWRPVF